MAIAERFDWPIAAPGDEGSRESALDYPSPWKNTNKYKNKYLLGGGYTLHTGNDLLIVGTADEYASIYAIADGIVVASANYKKSWGHIIVIRHELLDGSRVWSRYAHVANPKVVKGQLVTRGEVIAECGNADGYYHRSAFHLHYDIAITDILETKSAADWPGLDIKRLERDYVDPRAFIRAHRTVEVEPEVVIVSDVRRTTGNVNMRWIPSTTGKILRLLPLGTQVRLAGAQRNANKLIWQLVTVDGTDQCGWCAENFLGPMTPTRSKFGLNFIGPGAFPEATAMIDRLAKAGKPLALAVVINEPGLVATIKVLSPTTKVVYRHTAMPAGPTITGDIVKDRAAGRAFFNQYWPLLAGGAGADFFQFCNEWMPYDSSLLLAGAVAAYDGLMDEAQSKGVKITVGDLNVGHPALAIAYLLNPMLLRAAQLGFPLNYHSYTRPGTTDPSVEGPGRTMRWVDYLKPGLKVIIGEYGPDDGNAAFPGAEKCVQMCKQFDELLTPYASQVLGYGYWAESAGHSWPQSDVTPALPQIEAWLKAF